MEIDKQKVAFFFDATSDPVVSRVNAMIDAKIAENSTIQVLERECTEWKFCEKLCRSTHSPLHQVEWVLKDVLKQTTEGRAESGGQGDDGKIEKPVLLFHGTQKGNILSVVQHGLKIAPEGVDHVGAMFGPGIYLANIFTVSLAYSRDRKERRNKETVFVLMCRALLGKTDGVVEPEPVNLQKFDSRIAFGEWFSGESEKDAHPDWTILDKVERKEGRRGVDYQLTHDEYVL